jgi:hypothetical protein
MNVIAGWRSKISGPLAGAIKKKNAQFPLRLLQEVVYEHTEKYLWD